MENAPGPPTWRELWAAAAAELGDRTRARWICETAAGAFGDDFAELLDEHPSTRIAANVRTMLDRAGDGEPLQYVLGHWGFRHLDLAVDRRVLIPRPETESVAGVAIELAATFGPIRMVADLGTGSGAIGLALADELPLDGTTVWITDDDDDALAVAGANLAGIGRAARNVRIGRGSWTAALPSGVLFDVVVSNPPYVAEGASDVEAVVSEWEPRHALFAGPDGLDEIRRIVAGALGVVRPGGWLVLEIGADQRDAVTSLLVERGFADVDVRDDLAGRPRIALGRRPVTIFVDDGEPPLVVRHLRNDLDDTARMLRWLRTPDVLEWFGGRDRDVDLDDVLEEYGPGGEHERDGTIRAVFELGGRPAGYLQLYELERWAAEFDLDDGAGVWSLDLFIGEPELHGTGLGRRVVRATAEYLLAERAARDVVIMPYPENERAVAAYRAAGFVDDAIVRDHEVHEGVMRDGLRMVYRPR